MNNDHTGNNDYGDSYLKEVSMNSLNKVGIESYNILFRIPISFMHMLTIPTA